MCGELFIDLFFYVCVCVFWGDRFELKIIELRGYCYSGRVDYIET